MTKPSKDKVERYYFEQFCKIYRFADGSSVAYGDKPDVIVRNARKVGIEITNFFVQSGRMPESEQQQRPLRHKVIADAHTIYLTAGENRAELTVGFSKDNPIAPDRMKSLSNDLAAFARSRDGQASGPIDGHFFRKAMPEIDSIYFNSTLYNDAKWQIAQLHSPELMSISALQAIIREKEQKVSQYEVCDAYWLLIVVNGIDPAQDQEIRINGFELVRSVFEKIIIFHTFGHLVEIATTTSLN